MKFFSLKNYFFPKIVFRKNIFWQFFFFFGKKTFFRQSQRCAFYMKGQYERLCILNVGTVPTLCILNVGTVPTCRPSELVHLNDHHYFSL